MAMFIKPHLYIIFTLVLTGCNFIKLDRSSTSIDEDTIQFQSKFSYTDSSRTAFFVSENFASDALNNYTVPMISNEYLGILSLSKEPVINKHDSTIVDTIYTFSNPGNKIQFYRTSENDFITTFDITDSIFRLTGNVKPGMTKDIFLLKFKITESTTDKVQISNSEGSMRFMFYFENNKLKRIKSYLYLD